MSFIRSNHNLNINFWTLRNLFSSLIACINTHSLEFDISQVIFSLHQTRNLDICSSPFFPYQYLSYFLLLSKAVSGKIFEFPRNDQSSSIKELINLDRFQTSIILTRTLIIKRKFSVRVGELIVVIEWSYCQTTYYFFHHQLREEILFHTV